jgi:hypothetical protein
MCADVRTSQLDLLSGRPKSAPISVGCAWLLVASLLLRLAFATTGTHIDFDTYQLVADASLAGKNFYVDPGRYNYAPFWGWWVTLLRWATGPWFRYGVLATLTAADLFLITWLYRRGKIMPAILWGLLPIQAVITGFQNMFDILGVIPAILAVALLERNRTGKGNYSSDKIVLRATLLLALSLCLKHIYFFFPFWLFFRTPDRKQRAMLLIIPLALFFVSFIPMLPHGGAAAIRYRVFSYTGGIWYNFWAELFPDIMARFDEMIPGLRIRSILFFTSMLTAGILLRKRPLYESLLLYGVCMFISTTGRFVHYQTFILPFLITYRNRWAWATLAYGSIVVLTTPYGTLWKYVRPDLHGHLYNKAYEFLHGNWDLHISILLILTWITKDFPNIWRNSLQRIRHHLTEAVLYGRRAQEQP